MKRIALLLVLSLLLGMDSVLAQSPSSTKPKRVLATGITGQVKSSGLNNPQYVLSFPQIQQLILQAAKGSVTQAEIDAAVAGTPVKRNDLLRLGLLRQDQNVYHVAYLVLTVEDQRAIYRVAKEFGIELAREIEQHRKEFDGFFSRYGDAARRGELAFDLVAGMLLNWEGLKLNTELGYRPAPVRQPNGDAYFLHSEELGADLPEEGMYWGSHSFPGQHISFSTFGDGASLPRLRGIPDALFDPVEDGLGNLKNMPEMEAAATDEFIAYLSIALTDAGDVMAALADGPQPMSELSRHLNYSGDRLNATISLLLAAGYIERDGLNYRLRVPILTERDRPMVNDFLTFGRALLRTWLTRNYELIKRELAALSPMRNGLPFTLAFNEVWHYIFGWTTKTLAEDGFYVNPRSPQYFYRGYVPLVWDSSLYNL